MKRHKFIKLTYFVQNFRLVIQNRHKCIVSQIFYLNFSSKCIEKSKCKAGGGESTTIRHVLPHFIYRSTDFYVMKLRHVCTAVFHIYVTTTYRRRKKSPTEFYSQLRHVLPHCIYRYTDFTCKVILF